MVIDPDKYAGTVPMDYQQLPRRRVHKSLFEAFYIEISGKIKQKEWKKNEKKRLKKERKKGKINKNKKNLENRSGALCIFSGGMTRLKVLQKYNETIKFMEVSLASVNPCSFAYFGEICTGLCGCSDTRSLTTSHTPGIITCRKTKWM